MTVIVCPELQLLIRKSVLNEKVENYIDAVLNNLPCTDRRLEQIKDIQHNDEICMKLMEFTNDGWPQKQDLPSLFMPYYQFRDYFSIHNGLLLKSDRIIIPASLRVEILELIHAGHLGIEKCRQRAIRSVWWPGLSAQVEQMVKKLPYLCT
jgi:hypothetical protein